MTTNRVGDFGCLEPPHICCFWDVINIIKLLIFCTLTREKRDIQISFKANYFRLWSAWDGLFSFLSFLSKFTCLPKTSFLMKIRESNFLGKPQVVYIRWWPNAKWFEYERLLHWEASKTNNLLHFPTSSIPKNDFSFRPIWAAVRINSLNPLFQLFKCEIWSFMKHEKIKIATTKASINHLPWLIGFAILFLFSYNLLVLQVFHFAETVAKWKWDKREIIFHVLQDINWILCDFLMLVHPHRQAVERARVLSDMPQYARPFCKKKKSFN